MNDKDILATAKSLTDLVVHDDNDRLIQGYASVEVVDRQGDIVPVEAMEKAMLKYMERGGNLLYAHLNKPVGKVLQWHIEEHPQYKVPAVKITAMIFKDYQLENEVWKYIKDGKLKGFSIGGVATQTKTVKADDTNVRVLDDIELSEISVVAEPANQGALISAKSIAKSAEVAKDEPDQKNEKHTLTDDEILEQVFSRLKNKPTEKPKAEPSITMHGNPKREHIDVDPNSPLPKGPTNPFWNSCITAAIVYSDKNGLNLTNGQLHGLCGFMFYHRLNADHGKANAWGLYDPEITDEDFNAWLKFTPKRKMSSDTKYKVNNKTPYSFPNLVNRVDVSDPREFINRRIPDDSKSLVKDYRVEIMKPFADFENWSDCVKKQKAKGHSAKSAAKICGYLKHRYEKSLQKDFKLDVDEILNYYANNIENIALVYEEERDVHATTWYPKTSFETSVNEAYEYVTQSLVKQVEDYLDYIRSLLESGKEAVLDYSDLNTINDMFISKEDELSGITDDAVYQQLYSEFIGIIYESVTPQVIADFLQNEYRVFNENKGDGMNEIDLSLTKIEKAIDVLPLVIGEVLKAKYPWDKCIREQKKKYHSEEKAKKICGSIKAKYSKAIDAAVHSIDTNDISKDTSSANIKYNNNIQGAMKKEESAETFDDCVQRLTNNGVSSDDAQKACGYIQYQTNKADKKSKFLSLILNGKKKSETNKGDDMNKVNKESEDAELDRNIERKLDSLTAKIEKLIEALSAIGLPEEEDNEGLPDLPDMKEEADEEQTGTFKEKANIAAASKKPQEFPEDAGLSQKVRAGKTIPPNAEAEEDMKVDGSAKFNNVSGGIKDGQDNYLGRDSTNPPKAKVETLKGKQVNKAAQEAYYTGKFVDAPIGDPNLADATNGANDIHKSLEMVLTGKAKARNLYGGQ